MRMSQSRYGAYSDWLVTGFAKRYTFLIDPDGRIAHSYLNVDTSRHSAEIIADLKHLVHWRQIVYATVDPG